MLIRSRTGSTESILVKMPHCWRSHVAAHILKTKSNFTLLIYIPFLGIAEWYFKCV